jgi:hypothetical protein
VEYTVTVFECRIVGGELGSLDGEAAELHFIDPSKRPKLNAEFPDALFAPFGSQPVLFW